LLRQASGMPLEQPLILESKKENNNIKHVEDFINPKFFMFTDLDRLIKLVRLAFGLEQIFKFVKMFVETQK